MEWKRDERLDSAFADMRIRATAFVQEYNNQLPLVCPRCGSDGHCAGLPCVDCGFEHELSLLFVLDDEFGYVAASLKNRKLVIAKFHVDGY